MIQRIGMVGSRKLPAKACEHYKWLAFTLAGMGYEIVSGGCPAGADEAALQGALNIDYPKITLFTVRHFHRRDAFPEVVNVVQCDLDTVDEVADLAYRMTEHDGQRDKYWGYFLRNGHIAHYSNVVIAWRSGDSGGTNHTLRCAKELGRPTIVIDEAARVHHWPTRGAMIDWVLGELRRLEEITQLAQSGEE